MPSRSSARPYAVAREPSCEAADRSRELDCETTVNVGPESRPFRLQSRKDLRAVWSVTWIALVLLGALVLLMIAVLGLQRSTDDTEEQPAPVSQERLLPGAPAPGPSGATPGDAVTRGAVSPIDDAGRRP
jgi:hypothetical protein